MTKDVEFHKPDSFLTAFVRGARKGFDLTINVILPNSFFAFILNYLLTTLGIMDILGMLLKPLMGLFGLPGEAAVPLLISYVTTSGGLVSAAGLVPSGILSPEQLTIMIPFIFLVGATVQYVGRILAPSGLQAKHYKYILGISSLNGILSLFVMRLLLAVLN